MEVATFAPQAAERNLFTLGPDTAQRLAVVAVPETRPDTVQGCIQKFPDWPPGTRTVTALCHWIQLYRYLVSESSKFCHHNPLCCYSTSNTTAICFSAVHFVLPTVSVLYWKNSTRFYGTNGMCFPLHIDDPFFVGWQYSAFIFLGLNFSG